MGLLVLGLLVLGLQTVSTVEASWLARTTLAGSSAHHPRANCAAGTQQHPHSRATEGCRLAAAPSPAGHLHCMYTPGLHRCRYTCRYLFAYMQQHPHLRPRSVAAATREACNAAPPSTAAARSAAATSSPLRPNRFSCAQTRQVFLETA